jgi:glyoxylate/hydroxypyruvate reductase A
MSTIAGDMRITFCCSDTRPQPWLDGFRAALPEAVIEVWSPGSIPADYAVVWAPPQKFFDEQTRLKAVFNIGAGVDALMSLRLPEGLPVVRMDDAGMAVQMAEYVCHAVIEHFREFDAYAADIAEGRWSYRKPRRRDDFPVGVMGLGVLGQRVCSALAQFDFPVRGWSRSAKLLDGVRCFHGEGQLNDFLSASRTLVCLLPLTPDTEGLLRRETLSRLQPGAYLINVARGGHLIDEDLVALLDSGQMAGATLDVFRAEPLPPAHPFWRHPKIRITPHTSARTLREESIAQIAHKIRAFDGGAPIASLAGVVDLKKGY